MDDVFFIETCERALAASWPGRVSWAQPSWEIRFADGYTKRANSLWIFDPVNAPPGKGSFHAWKDWLASRGQPFYVKPPLHPAWDRFLENWQGFPSRVADPGLVMGLSLSQVLPDPVQPSPGLMVTIKEAPFEGWLGNSSPREKSQPSGWGLAGILEVVGPAGLAYSLVFEGQLVGWALLTVKDGWGSAASVEILDPFRGRGWGRFLMGELLAAAQAQGAQHFALQVRQGNLVAQNLYRSLGFEPWYGYHYLKF